MKQFDTFCEPDAYVLRQLEATEPSCFNGRVSFRKYKVTIEPVEESADILAGRLQHMWDVCDNHHNWQPLKVAAKSIGYDLKDGAGSKRKPRP